LRSHRRSRAKKNYPNLNEVVQDAAKVINFYMKRSLIPAFMQIYVMIFGIGHWNTLHCGV